MRKANTMRKKTSVKRLIILMSYLLITSVMYGQGELRKEAFDVNADSEHYEYYLHDSLICISEYDTISKREIFIKFSEAPFYGDSMLDTFKYIYNNLKSPDPYADLKGRVIVQFIVEIDGTLSNFKILRSFGNCYGNGAIYDKEAIKVLKNMPKWTSGKCNGEKVPAYLVLPINFRP